MLIYDIYYDLAKCMSDVYEMHITSIHTLELKKYIDCILKNVDPKTLLPVLISCITNNNTYLFSILLSVIPHYIDTKMLYDALSSTTDPVIVEELVMFCNKLAYEVYIYYIKCDRYDVIDRVRKYTHYSDYHTKKLAKQYNAKLILEKL